LTNTLQPFWRIEAARERGGSIALMPFLGHAMLETTQIYAESSAEMIKASYQKAMAG
jgi:site-specific recombinase XerC